MTLVSSLMDLLLVKAFHCLVEVFKEWYFPGAAQVIK